MPSNKHWIYNNLFSKKCWYFKINDYMKSEIQVLFRKYFPQVNPTLIFFNNHKLKNFTHHKDKLPPKHCSLVVYEFKCPVCQLGYIGSTKRTLQHRIHEHLGTSYRTGIHLSSPSKSSIREHCLDNCKCVFSDSDFRILYRGDYEVDIRIAESI